MFLEAHNLPSKNVTVNFCGQISVHIFAPNKGKVCLSVACV